MAAKPQQQNKSKHLIYRYTVNGRSWELDWYDLTLDDLAELRRITGYRASVLVVEHDAGDALAMKAMLWMARRKAGEKDLDFTDESLAFTVREMHREIVKDTQAEERAAAAQDPQQPPAPEPAPTKAQPSNSKTRSKR